jgi:putative DNA modification/repair radical SAM protein
MGLAARRKLDFAREQNQNAKMAPSVEDKLALLADAAKYDASCASSGSTRKDSRAGGIGSTGGNGICHSYAPDGRSISLLKILLTNFCVYDCAYCINRRSSNVQRARFSVDEVVRLTLDFYKRNYIEGLFLSSGIIRNPDYTMEELVRVARTLREDHHFRGYIHLKTIPDASQELVEEAGRYADRISINVELPTDVGLKDLAPEKRGQSIRRAMAGMRLRIDEARAEKKRHRFAPAGQSTQMIVGADGADDRTILAASASLYSSYGLRRVYYSAFSPIPDASAKLPLKAPPLRREHRVYQADWLFRFYGFGIEELLPEHGGQMLDLELDPKLAWALENRAFFPVELNRGSREQLLRVPGLGVRSVDRIMRLRRHRAVRLQELSRLGVSVSKVAPFVVGSGLGGVATSRALLDRLDLRARIAPRQLSLLDHA